MGGTVPLGYDVKDRKLVVNPDDAKTVVRLFNLYLSRQKSRSGDRRSFSPDARPLGAAS